MHSDEKRTDDGAGVGRREFLLMAIGTGLGLVLPASVLAAPTETKEAAKWVQIGKADQFVANQPRRVVLPNSAGVIYVTRAAGTPETPGALTALSARCTHRGCEVGWDPKAAPGGEFICPCHGAVFTPDGKNVRGPARKPLVPVLVKENAGQVLVDLAAAAAAAQSAAPPRRRPGGEGAPPAGGGEGAPAPGSAPAPPPAAPPAGQS